jgi:EAL domain-containing protein (putative c-di-GMP-specific phosphodiesterase class I)
MSVIFDQILDRTMLTPRFQGIVSLREHRLFGYEATIRGPSDSPFHTPEALFLEAHLRGRLVRLDLLCREAAIREFCRQRLPGRLFLNVTAVTLQQPDFSPGHTLQYLDRYGLPPEEIVIELTEQHPIDDFGVMRRAVCHYRNCGFAVAIDDMGAGYAGLRLWEELRPDYVKIDRHFIQGISGDPVKRHFVAALQTMAGGLGCSLVAEGIENAADWQAVLSLGIDLGQGYFFARPQASPPRFLARRSGLHCGPDAPAAIQTLNAALMSP